jgi:radical SAM superfamily enzyme YgiQ (UPF0313 family)
MWSPKLEEFLTWIKTVYPSIITIIGGQQCQMIESGADYFVNGYGENAILNIVKHHFTNSTDQLMKDLRWSKLGKNVVGHDHYPSAPLDSLLIQYEDRDYIDQNEWLSIEFSRGCKFECTFCNYPLLGVKYDHSRTAQDFDKHLRDAHDRFGVTNYYICDETFNDSVEKMSKFANVVRNLDFQPKFSAFIRADLMVARPQDRDLMLAMGVIGHFYGIETMNAASGKIIGKGMHPDKLLPGLLDIKSYFKKHGPYRGDLSLIVGLPEETEQSMSAALKWLYENWQGESAIVWPLGLPDDPMYNKLNKLSINREKYGYRQSNMPVPDDPSNIISSTLLNWENDYFTYARAMEISTNAAKELNRLDFRVSCWNLGEYGMSNIYDVIELPNSANMHTPIDRIEKYKRKKLGESL